MTVTIESNAILEAAARALRDTHGTGFDRMAEAVLAAITPLIRAAALEDAAQMIENYTKGGADVRLVIGDIRALARTPKEPGEHETYIWRKRRVYGEDDGPWPLPGDYHSSANEASIEQIKSALEEISKGIDLIDCSGPAVRQNIAVIKLIWSDLKRAFAALAWMERRPDHAALLAEAVKALEPFARQNLNEMASEDVNRARHVLIRLRAAVEGQMEQP